MAYLLFIVQEHGSNVDEYSKLLTDEVNRKLLEAQKFNGKNYNNTCQPLH
jgi:membrane protein involved in colicin uptake